MKTCSVQDTRGACRTAQVIQIPCFARPRPRPTLSEAGRAWLAASEGRLKPSTLSIYAGILRAHIDPVLGLRPLHALSGREIEAFLCEKAAPREGMPGLAPRTVSNISTVLHGIFDHACRTGSLRESPAWTCPAGRAAKNTAVLDAREKKILTRHLLNNINTGQRADESFGLLLCLYTGMRLGEICALRWGDVTPRPHSILVHRTVQRISDPAGHRRTALVFGSPKSPSSDRVIPMPHFLHRLADRQRREDECFILTGTPSPMDPRTMQNHFKAVLRRCGLRQVNFHAIRHTFATDCVGAGFDPKTLSSILGHADVSVTLNTYVHPSFDVMRRFMDKLRPAAEL